MEVSKIAEEEKIINPDIRDCAMANKVDMSESAYFTVYRRKLLLMCYIICL